MTTNNTANTTSSNLLQTLLTEIQNWNPILDPLHWSDEKFDTLARALFTHQFNHNNAYRSYCETLGKTPDNVTNYLEIPAVPTDAFKYVHLTSAQDIVRTFQTSGTTADARGQHHFSTLDLYKAALQGPFQRFVLPESTNQEHSVRILILAPSATDLPDSSLSFMFDELMQRWADPESGYFFTKNPETQQIQPDFAALKIALDKAQAENTPAVILGTAFGFIEFFDNIPQSWNLPKGSRIMETGGFKGRTREVSRDELYQLFTDRLGIAPEYCVSEYSMTELSSQAYADTLHNHVSNNPQTPDQPAPTRLRTPPWTRIVIADPITLTPLTPPNQRGLIRWIDLANFDSVCAVQTSDMGTRDPDGGFLLLGRAPDTELRGCSLTIEEIITANT